MKKATFILIVTILCTGNVFSQDISGYWQGVYYQNTGGPSAYYPTSMQLFQSGNTITGTSTSRLPNGSPSYVIVSVTGTISNKIFTYNITGIIQQVAPPFPYYWCPNGTGVLTYDSASQTLKGPTNSQGCAGVGRTEIWRLKTVGDTVFCHGTPVRLSVTGQNLKWYSNSSLTKLVDMGNTVVPKITTTTTFYVTQTHYNTESPAIPVTAVIISPALSTINQTICEGKTYLGYQLSGKYIDTFRSSAGCDSIRTLNLTVKPRAFSTINYAICEGQIYFGHNTSGRFTDTFPSSSGCDSIRTLNLTVNPKALTTINQTICEGQNYLGHYVSGKYVDTFSSSFGCDSIRILNLTVKPRLFATINQTICEGQRYMGHNASGKYIDTIHLPTGCDSVITLNLTVKQRALSAINKSICEGEVYFGHTTSGTYRDTLVAINGCDSIRTLTLSVLKQPAPFIGNDTTICEGDNLVLFPGQFSSYTWQDNSTQSRLTVKQPGLYYVTVTNSCGSAKAQIKIVSTDCKFHVPNAFSPNGDGINDTWIIPFLSSYPNCKVDIFNRYGQLLFHSNGYSKPWNGTYNGASLPFGIYYWIINLNNGVARMTGSVTILH